MDAIRVDQSIWEEVDSGVFRSREWRGGAQIVTDAIGTKMWEALRDGNDAEYERLCRLAARSLIPTEE